MSSEILTLPYYLSLPHLSQLTCECTWTILPCPILHDPQNRMLSNIIQWLDDHAGKIFYFMCCCQSSCFVTNPCWAFLLALTVHRPFFLHPCIQWAVHYKTWTVCLFVLDPTVAGSTVLWNVDNTVHYHIVQRVKNRISTKHKSQWKFFV